MIQTEVWIILAGMFALLTLSAVYLIYVLITSKLFPQTLGFYKIINPNENVTISSIEGSGIIKKIEISVGVNNQSIVTVIADRTRCMVIRLDEKAPRDPKQDSFSDSVNFEINLNKKFRNEFSIFLQNRGECNVQLNGNVNFEIRKPLWLTIKTLFSELVYTYDS